MFVLNHAIEEPYPMDPWVEEGIDVVLIVMMILLAIGLLVRLALYLVRAAGLYTMAKSRNLSRPWLAWIPVGQSWILGSLCDQYQYVVHGKVWSMRKWMLALGAAGLILGGFSAGLQVGEMMVSLLEEQGVAVGDWIVLPMLGLTLVHLVGSLVTGASTVLDKVALYHVYKSCTRHNAVLFLILSILVEFAEPFFIFFLRNKEEGMPPRRYSTSPELE